MVARKLLEAGNPPWREGCGERCGEDGCIYRSIYLLQHCRAVRFEIQIEYLVDIWYV